MQHASTGNLLQVTEKRQWRISIKQKVTLGTLAIFVLGIWALSYYITRMLRDDMQKLLADQQDSTVSYVASELNQALEERIKALETIASSIDQSILDNPASLRQMLGAQPISVELFNSGVVAVTLDGTAVADAPVVSKRQGTNYINNEATHIALTEGRTVIGRPVVGRVLHEPLFNINVPIRDAGGKVIGALFGVINLAKPNFLDRIGEHRYGKSGGYLVAAPQYNLIVTATDKSRVMQPLPPPGANETFDRRVKGFYGPVIASNSMGVELLSSASPLPVAGWLVIAALPTDEAFAPIHDMQRRILAATILLTLIAGALSWWLLRRQLSPLVNASKMVKAMSGPGKSLHPLPVANRDEIGQLVGGFNELLEIIRQREAQLSTERDFFSALLKQSSDGVLLFSPDDHCVREANPSLCTMLGYAHDELCTMNLGDLVDAPMESMDDNTRHNMQGVAFVIGERNCRRKDGSRICVEVSAAVVETDRGQLIMANLRDITERKRVEQALARESHRNKVFLRNASDGVHILDADGCVLEASDSFCEMLGYSHDELLGASVALWDVQWSAQELRQLIAEQVAQEHRSIFETRHRRQNGTLVDVEVTGRALELDGKRVLFNSARDITERKRAEEQLHLAASVFTHAREGILITTPDGTIIDVNATFTHITGYSREEILGRNPRILGSGRQSKEFYAALWGDLIEKGHWSGEVWNRRKNGEAYAEMLTISAVRDAQGDTRQYVALFSDISASKEHEKQLEHIAHYDTLTGLPNRALLADRLKQAIAQAHRRTKPLAVAYLDLDGFKLINDRHGHGAGDQLLMSMAAGMKQALREGDTLARLGGDEFVAVLLDLPDAQASVPMLTRLLAAAAEPVHVGDLMLKISASLGVTFYPQADDVDADQLLRQADQAMYQAKLAGKNRYHIFDAEQDRSVRGRHESLERIHHAMIEREFVLYYQPEVNMRTGTVIGAEALIRWKQPEKGLLLPAVFLPMIEDHPLAIEIGEWVIDTALTEMTHWQACGLDIPVSVNVGARQLQQAAFPERLRKILAAHPHVRPGDLELEVLETSALEDVVRVSEIMEACCDIGVTFALDDFGTGYSSLIYLKRLPVNRLKIDQSFVRDMLEDPDDLAILEGVIGLATAFRRQVIAEGVETVEHGEMLLQLGCELAQGYGVARPMPACELSAWSAAWRPDSAWINCRPISRHNLPLLFVRVEHRAWIAAIEAFLMGERAVAPHLDCHFGKWPDAESLSRHGAQPVFQTIEGLHRQVHALAAELCELRAQGRIPEVLARLGELRGLRDLLLGQMKARSQERRQ